MAAAVALAFSAQALCALPDPDTRGSKCNNGKGGSPNHRHAMDQATIDTMVAQGWIDEGVAICVPAGP